MNRHSAASIRARLKNHADATRQDFNQILTRYGLERLLYRVSVSPHAQNFLLKGALLFALWFDAPHRPTRDADLLGFGSDDPGAIAAMFREICAIEADDGIAFDPATVRASEIRTTANYGGVRVELNATLAGARLALQVDIGFGDVVTPDAHEIVYPTLLADMPAPHLRVYPRETAFAEKLEAVVQLGLPNSRMKDYFDLLTLARENAMATAVLAQAIAATFARRGTPLPTSLPIGLTEAFAHDPAKQTQWHAFLRKSRLTAPDLAEVVAELAAFAKTPMTRALALGAIPEAKKPPI